MEFGRTTASAAWSEGAWKAQQLCEPRRHDGLLAGNNEGRGLALAAAAQCACLHCCPPLCPDRWDLHNAAADRNRAVLLAAQAGSLLQAGEGGHLALLYAVLHDGLYSGPRLPYSIYKEAPEIRSRASKQPHPPHCCTHKALQPGLVLLRRGLLSP
jgi:hypothetical protein